MKLFTELKQEKYLSDEVILHADNEATIKLSSNNIFYSPTKHIQTRYLFIEDAIQKNSIQLKYVLSESTAADFSNKKLSI